MIRIRAHAHHHREVARDLSQEGILPTVPVVHGAPADGVQPQDLSKLEEQVAQFAHQVVIPAASYATTFSATTTSAAARHGDDGRN